MKKINLIKEKKNKVYFWLRFKIAVKLWLINFARKLVLISFIFLLIAAGLYYKTCKEKASTDEVRVLKERISELETFIAEADLRIREAGSARKKAEEKAEKEKNARKRVVKEIFALKKSSADKTPGAREKALQDEVRTLKERIKNLENSIAEVDKKVKTVPGAREKALQDEVRTLKERIKNLENSIAVAEKKIEEERKARELAEKARKEIEKIKAGTEKKTKKIKTYEVAEGDTLSSIAEKIYGDSSRWKDIFKANKEVLKNKGVVKGLILAIPE